MTIYQFCTIEWLNEVARKYRETLYTKYKSNKLSAKICYRVKSNMDWGILEDIIFGVFMEKGELKELNFFSEVNAFKKTEYLMSASPETWKKIFTKESEFLTYLMLDKIRMELGTKNSMLDPTRCNDILDIFTLVNIQFPDEMSENEFIEYRSKIKTLRLERDP